MEGNGSLMEMGNIKAGLRDNIFFFVKTLELQYTCWNWNAEVSGFRKLLHIYSQTIKLGLGIPPI
jgi:hypothetical protein